MADESSVDTRPPWRWALAWHCQQAAEKLITGLLVLAGLAVFDACLAL
jgi:HEPN domain-containing protein